MWLSKWRKGKLLYYFIPDKVIEDEMSAIEKNEEELKHINDKEIKEHKDEVKAMIKKIKENIKNI